MAERCHCCCTAARRRQHSKVEKQAMLLHRRQHHLAIRPQHLRGTHERIAILLHGRQHAIRSQNLRGTHLCHPAATSRSARSSVEARMSALLYTCTCSSAASRSAQSSCVAYTSTAPFAAPPKLDCELRTRSAQIGAHIGCGPERSLPGGLYQEVGAGHFRGVRRPSSARSLRARRS